MQFYTMRRWLVVVVCLQSVWHVSQAEASVQSQPNVANSGKSFAQYPSSTPLRYRMATSYDADRIRRPEESNSVHDSAEATTQEADRGSRHFTQFDACENSICEHVIRQAHGLARIKLLREYIKDTVVMLDRLVTAVDSQVVSAGVVLSRAVGTQCRAAHAVISQVTKIAGQTERRSNNNVDTWFPVK